MPSISLCSLIILARTSSTVLNKSERGQPCLVPDLRGRALSFSPLSMMFMTAFLEPGNNYMRYNWELNYGNENSGRSQEGEVNPEEL